MAFIPTYDKVDTVQLNLNLTFKRVLHKRYSANLSSRLRVTRDCMIQYHNLILNPCK